MGKRQVKAEEWMKKINDILRPRPCFKKDCKNYDNSFLIAVDGLIEEEAALVITEKYLPCLHCKYYLRDLNLYKK